MWSRSGQLPRGSNWVVLVLTGSIAVSTLEICVCISGNCSGYPKRTLGSGCLKPGELLLKQLEDQSDTEEESKEVTK
jgi:hypothetical protein